jgi:hypothetical protein
MKRLIFLSVLGMIQLSLLAQTSQSTKRPAIFFIQKSIDLGTITEGTNPTVEFKFFNSGTAPLLLKNVQASCGCTAYDWPKNPIMPKDSAVIKATFNSNGFAGQNIHKSLTVTTNVMENGKDQVVILFFKGIVVPKK